MKITRRNNKFIIGSTVLDENLLKTSPGLEKQLLTNALNLLKFPQRFGLDGNTFKFTSDIEQSGRILDVFSDAVWEYNPKTTVYEKKGKLSELFNNKSIIFNENTGKTYYLKDGKFKKISDLNFKVSRGDEVVRELETRVQDVEKRMGDSGNRFSIVSALPANPDKDTLYIVVGEGQIEDTELQGMDLTELTAKISECITSNLNLTTIVNTLKSGENSQNERMEEINNSFSSLEDDIANNSTEITSLNSRMSSAETSISNLNTKHDEDKLSLSTEITRLSSSLTTTHGEVDELKTDVLALQNTQVEHSTDIENIKTSIQDIASSDALVQLTSRVNTNEGNITNVQEALASLKPEDIEGLQEFIENNNGAIEVVSALPENPKENTLYIISGDGNSITLTQHDIDEFRAKIKENKDGNDVLDVELNNLKDTIVEFRSTLGQAVSSTADAIEVVNKSVNNNEQAVQTIQTELTDIKSSISSISSAQTSHGETISNLDNRISQLDTSIDERLDALDADEIKHDENIQSIETELTLVKNDIKGVDDKVQAKVKIVDTVPAEPEEETLYLISEEDNHSTIITVQDIVTLRNNVQELQGVISEQRETISSMNTVIEAQKNSLSTHELMLDNQAQIIRAHTDLINRMKSKLDMIEFDDLTLGDVTYELVVKNEKSE